MSKDSETILIVDDEKEIADLLEVYLRSENYQIRKFYDPLEALSSVEKEPVSLAILDVMMPGMDGFTLCSKIRQKYLFPVIMPTAKGEDIDKIARLYAEAITGKEVPDHITVSGGGTNPNKKYAFVNTNKNSLTMRSGKSTLTKLVQVVPSEATVEVIKTCTKWYKCKYNGQTGWLKAKYMKLL